MKTLLLLILPIHLLAQCAENYVVDGYVFGQVFSSDCEFYEPWQSEVLPCHGAINRQPTIRQFLLTEATAVRITINTSSDHLVATIWDACPYSGGEAVASVECGGYDCITKEGNQHTLIVTLPAGEYKFWLGLYSDGETCNGGFISGSITFDGECPPCPTFTMTGNYEEFTYCGEENEPYDPNIPCGFNTTYYTVQFDAQQPYTTINVTSQMNYTFAPTTPWNFAHLQLFDGCGGNQVWNTSSGACAVGGDLALTGEHPAQNYSVDLALPSGTYVLVFGYASIPEQFGCVTVGIGNPTFLDLHPEDHGAGRNHWGEKKPRYTKVVIEGRGVFIRDNYSGKIYDILTREQR